jgi:inositol-phosphate phosphatase/L-galactose 1-phosphate phosphatase/histidinol-phosphatase
MQEFLALANGLADAAGEITRKHFRQPFEVISKADESPVTVADRSIEEAIRALIEKARPEDGIYGEEFGIKESRNGLTWVIDPIDGTKSFVIGRPTFGTLIALCKDDVPVLGIIDQPISKERWAGMNGRTTLNNKIVKARPCPDLKSACAASTTPAMFSKTGPVYEKVEKATKMMAWGGDCYMYGLLASGHMDLCVEASLSPYDFCALVPVVEGAGGIMTDWSGKKLTIKSDGRVVAAGDASIHKEILKLLG